MNGTRLVIAAIVAQAVTNGLLSDRLDGDESLLLSLIAFGASALAAGIIQRRRHGVRPREPLRGERLRVMALLNGATAVTFLGFYTALTLAPAALAAAIETGIGPLALALGALRRPNTRDLRAVLLGAAALALALGAALRASTGETTHSAIELSGGLALAAIAGITAAGIATLSHRLGRLDVSPVTVTAHRFHLTYLLALGLLLLHPGDAIGSLTSATGALIVPLALLGVALPLFVLQFGMQRTPPIVVTLLASGVPGMTYLVAVVAGSQDFDALTFVLINGSLVLAFLGPRLIRPKRRPPGPGGASTVDAAAPHRTATSGTLHERPALVRRARTRGVFMESFERSTSPTARPGRSRRILIAAAIAALAVAGIIWGAPSAGDGPTAPTTVAGSGWGAPSAGDGPTAPTTVAIKGMFAQ
ncbi:hypothetical protein Afil01_30060 [Actinorhabdospora filicis]|uniref:EamA domain-containing protein n=1 Tax=Actinorhabdospora filicis TaxID=1785913 RepID=A0A9W6W946_9ACTN|nr:hypothetical protein [Actinorhabdospora filicis]GLZ78199.1 hypothetical protein Afil01_30060 [Actinorhabdospora filicis]